MVDVANVYERFNGLMSGFLIRGVIVGKNAGEMPAQGRGGKPTKFCKLTFMLPTAAGAPKTQDVSVPGEIDSNQFEVGQHVELPITISFFEGRLTFRALDPNANAREVGQAARDPARAPRFNVSDMGKTTSAPKVA